VAYAALLAREHEADARVVCDYFDAESDSVITESEFLRQKDVNPRERVQARSRIDVARQRMQRAEWAVTGAAQKHRSAAVAARERMARVIEQRQDYQRMVRTLIGDWAAQLDSALALAAVVEEGRRYGYPVQPIPPVLFAEIQQLISYAKDAALRGVVTAKDLPDRVRAMTEVGA
jgi:hypothetical protein